MNQCLSFPSSQSKKKKKRKRLLSPYGSQRKLFIIHKLSHLEYTQTFATFLSFSRTKLVHAPGSLHVLFLTPGVSTWTHKRVTSSRMPP